MPAKPSAAKEPEHTFESAIERLEQIVEAMESDKVPLEELLTRYEEGTKLVKTCQEKLESAEKRIEIIMRSSSGKPQLAAFDPGAAQPPAAAATKTTASPSDDVSLF